MVVAGGGGLELGLEGGFSTVVSACFVCYQYINLRKETTWFKALF